MASHATINPEYIYVSIYLQAAGSARAGAKDEDFGQWTAGANALSALEAISQHVGAYMPSTSFVSGTRLIAIGHRWENKTANE